MQPDVLLINTEALSCGVLLIGGLLVFIMQSGFCMLEAGVVQSRNSVHVAVKNLFDICIVTIAFLVIGNRLAFGESFAGLFGIGSFAEQRSSEWICCHLFFQVMFCGTAATIVSGAVTERMRTKAYLGLVVALSLVIYPTVVHWVWATQNGEPIGWLGKLGFIDFAGSTVVHGVGAWCALAIVLQLGPRRGAFIDDTSVSMPTVNSNLTHSILGVFILWAGWFGFNGASAHSDLELIPRILVNTFVAPAAGGAALIVWQCYTSRLIHLKPIMIGILGSLVAVTAGCHLLSIPAAMVIGIGGAVCALATSQLLKRLKIDDPLDAIACHGSSGIVGTVGLVALVSNDSLDVSRTQQLLIQLGGCLAVFTYSFSVMSVITWLWRKFASIRVTETEEKIGLNISEHGVQSEFHQLLSSAQYVSSFESPKNEGPVNDNEISNEFSEYGVLKQAIEQMMSSANQDADELKSKIDRTQSGALDALIDLCEYRDNETAAHLRRIQLYSVLLANQLRSIYEEIDDEFIENLHRASVLHDIGKIGIPDDVLLKPGCLNSEELALMRTHTSIGVDMLLKTKRRLDSCDGFFDMAIQVAGGHHERYDGTGYPRGIAGESIPLAARIVAIADVFDAMVSRRIYKDPIPAIECRAIILSESSMHFDPEVVAAFVVVFEDLVAIHREHADSFPEVAKKAQMA